MISALNHCEDPTCSQSSNNELIRLFRCSIHCDRLLCLVHLNAHNIYYEEEKKQHTVVLNELKNTLTLYQTIFEQQIKEYQEIVHQTTTLLLHNTSSIIPIEQIRPVLEKLQRAIAIFQQEQIVIKSELPLDPTESDIDSKDIPSIKKENHSPINNPIQLSQTVIIRLERIDYRLYNNSVSNIHDQNVSRKSTNKNQQQDNKRSKNLSPRMKKYKKMKKD